MPSSLVRCANCSNSIDADRRKGETEGGERSEQRAEQRDIPRPSSTRLRAVRTRWSASVGSRSASARRIG